MEVREKEGGSAELAALHEALSAGAPDNTVAAALRPLHPARVADFLLQRS